MSRSVQGSTGTNQDRNTTPNWALENCCACCRGAGPPLAVLTLFSNPPRGATTLAPHVAPLSLALGSRALTRGLLLTLSNQKPPRKNTPLLWGGRLQGDSRPGGARAPVLLPPETQADTRTPCRVLCASFDPRGLNGQMIGTSKKGPLSGGDRAAGRQSTDAMGAIPRPLWQPWGACLVAGGVWPLLTLQEG